MTSTKVLLTVLLIIGKECFADDPLVVDTPLGKVKGFTMNSRSGRVFSAFEGIPYAKPPVGDLRFKAPQPPEAWTGVLDSNPMPPCLQKDITHSQSSETIGQEDCLYLAVYTHNTSNSFPVLFYIHGGAFEYGGAMGSGPQYLMDEDILIVKIQYRLNILGFLSFESSDLPGNQGMKDQVMALRWVKNNIHLFGGNPENVTIMGESAGGASVYHHLVSPMSKGLFHKAISESGTSYGTWSLLPPGYAKKHAKKVIEELGCPVNLTYALPCLRDMNATRLVGFHQDTIIKPVFESGNDSFLTWPISEWVHSPVPLFIGMTSAEGLMMTLAVLDDDKESKRFLENMQHVPASVLEIDVSSSKPNETTKAILGDYFLDKSLSSEDWINITKLLTDSFFAIPVLDGISNHKGPVYAYYFDYIENGFIPSWLKDKDIYYGAIHVAETYLIWQQNISLIPGTDADQINLDLSKRLVKMISNFVQHGNPTPEKNGFIWKKWMPEEKNFLHINKTANFNNVESILDEKYKFWKSLKYRDLYDVKKSGASSLNFHTFLSSICLFISSYLFLKN